MYPYVNNLNMEIIVAFLIFLEFCESGKFM